MLVSRSSFFLVLHASRISYVLSCDASLTTIISVFCFSMAAVFMRSCTVFSRELSSLYAGTTRESQIPFFPFPFFSLFVFSIFAIFISLYFCYLFLLCPSLPLLCSFFLFFSTFSAFVLIPGNKGFHSLLHLYVRFVS